MFSAVSAHAAPFYFESFVPVPSVEAMTSLGRALFSDASLSASGRTSCATCHDPAHAFGQSNKLAVQRAGANGTQPGLRAVPSLKYLQRVPAFIENLIDDEGDDSVDQGPAGGLMWDGRAQSAHEQAAVPLFSPFEMANPDTHAVVDKVRRGSHSVQFKATFGAAVFSDEELAFKGILMALESYQQDPAEFFPYSSRYDEYLRGRAKLSVAEARGLATFEDPAKGNCARCHPSAMHGGAMPPFTDFAFAAIGVPRNSNIPANRLHAFHDLGLCGPLRTDYTNREDYCGKFRTPSLRNVATRAVYFHNGLVHDLAAAVRFYAQRDREPQHWYPRGKDGAVAIYDDIPPVYWRNLDRLAPFSQKVGGTAGLSAQDVEDIVTFLRTLTDGYERPVE